MNLTSSTPETESFLNEWFSDTDYVTAHTSGSTGVPKEIRLLKKDMIASARATNRFFKITEKSTLVCPLSASYIAGKMMIVRALESGATLKMLTPSNSLNPEGYITLLPIVPSQIESLCKLSTSNFHIDNVIIGGAPMSPEMENRLLTFPAACYATFGMTETCSHVALRRVGTPLFHALPGISFATDSDSRLVINLTQFSCGKLTTNDIVELHSPESFRWLGRFDNVVNSGGIKLFPEQIESMIAPFISGEFYLCGKPHDKWGEQLVICVTPKTEIDMQGMRDNIPHTHLPKEVITLQQFEYTLNGKIRRVIP